MSSLTIETVLARSATRLQGLHPIVAAKAEQLIRQTYDAGVPISIVQGLRTMDEQAVLYAQGRTRPGPIVTNARAGQSYHNYGLAVDYALLMPDGKTISWDTARDGDLDGQRDWIEVAQIGKSLGFDWGGDWNGFVDMPHLEMAFGLSITALLSGKRPPDVTEEPKEEEPEMEKKQATVLIGLAKAAWREGVTKIELEDGTMQEITEQDVHDAANAVRRASGQPEQ